jgi:hypothetical protein
MDIMAMVRSILDQYYRGEYKTDYHKRSSTSFPNGRGSAELQRAYDLYNAIEGHFRRAYKIEIPSDITLVAIRNIRDLLRQQQQTPVSTEQVIALVQTPVMEREAIREEQQRREKWMQ